MQTTNIIAAILAAAVDALEGDPALAERLRRVLGLASGVDDLLDVDPTAAEIAGEKPRVLLDESRRGRLELLGRRGHWRVRRSELLRWMTERRPALAKTKTANDVDDDSRAEARRAVDRAAERAAKGGR